MSETPQFPRRIIFRGALSAVALASLAACTGTSNASQGGSPNASGPAYDSGFSASAQPKVAPLTGLASTSATLAGPALALKIPNDVYGARPQININRADQVYEELVEGGITRYVAIFHSDIPDTVGPLRSFRPMDPAIMHPYNPVVVFSGGQAPFIRLLKATGLTYFNESSGAAYMSRLYNSSAPEKVAPDNLVLAAEKLWKANESQKPPTQLFNYSTDVSDASATTAGSSAKKLNVTMSLSSSRVWQWDASDKVWVRSQDGEKDMQYNSKFATSRVNTVNVVVVKVDIDRSKYASLHGSPPYTKLFGSGTAYIATGGKVLKAKWSKGTDTSSPLTLTGVDGLPIRLAPGRTWFELVPKDVGSFKFSA